uniref:cytoplasmic polyadenylation element-binding protein 1-B-like n=1 Tax=Myxine glutinosa TaxID=7769 RepID=UPI00358F71D4
MATNAVAIKLPEFWEAQADVWFVQAEAKFQLRGITADETRPDLAGDDLSASYFYRVFSYYMKFKDVQVIPWLRADSKFDCGPCEPRMEPVWTVFVGSLHGMITSETLARVFNKLFGGVVRIALNTDKHEYPIGSGRVMFGNHESYLMAIQVAFVEITTETFTKKIQIDPYLKYSVCQICCRLPGTFFCREMMCFKYFCKFCWDCHHRLKNINSHRPVMRKKRDNPEW